MNYKKFEYQHKDVPALKKEIIFRCVFAGLFFLVFVWQFIAMIAKLSNTKLTGGMVVSTCLVMLLCLLFCALSLLYCIKANNIINVIKKTGKCVSSVDVMFNLKRDSFIRLYSIINAIITLIASLLLICSITYSILEIAFYANINYYIPLLAIICLTGFYSAYHIQVEINTMKNVEEFNAQ